MSEPQFSNTDLKKQCRQQLEAWRLTRPPPGGVLPQALWRAAVWTFQQRLSSGRFWAWPKAQGGGLVRLEAHQLQMLLWNGDPQSKTAPMWRPLCLAKPRKMGRQK